MNVFLFTGVLSYLQIMDFKLSSGDMEKLKKVGKNIRLFSVEM